jgi:hypothetical protein
MMEEVWKASYECLKAELEKQKKEYEKIIEKKNQEIRQLVAVIERGIK